MMFAEADPIGLDALEARLRQDLEWLDYPAKAWTPPRLVAGRDVRDVVIIGAGMCGLVAGAALRRLGIHNLEIYDRAAEGLEGPWMTFARMETLRSPKQLTGPALGLPALTFRAWHEAQFGRQAWDALGKIPRGQWMGYLIWYRRVLGLPVFNNWELKAIRAFGPDLVEIDLEGNGVANRVLARRLVLATGRDGLGGRHIPAFMNGIDRRFWVHSADDIDFVALKGKRVGVIGTGASAVDNAAAALEAGASSLDLFVRRPDLPRINKFTGFGSPGVVHGFEALPDDWKWRVLRYLNAEQTPPRDSTLRVSRHSNARLHLSAPIERVELAQGALRVTTARGAHGLDFLICASGFRVDLARRPELVGLAADIRLWRDRFIPAEGEESDELAFSPDLGPDFEFQEKAAGACPVLGRIHCFNFPATLSHGRLSGDIPSTSEGADRLARGIVRSLFVEDRERHFLNLLAFDTPELLGDEWPAEQISR